MALLELGILEERYFSLLTFTTLLFLVGMPSIISVVFGKATHSEEVREADMLIPTYARMALEEVKVSDIMSELQYSIPQDTPARDFIDKQMEPGRTHYIVTDQVGHLVGVLKADAVDLVPRNSTGAIQVKHLMEKRYPVAFPEDSLYSVVEKMVEHRTSLVPVVVSEMDRKILGVVPRSNIFGRLVRKANG